MSDEFAEIEAPVVPKTFDQLGILVLDGSASMGEEALNKMSKADAVSLAVRELITRMKVSKNKSNFSFAIVTFDTDARVHTEITPVVDLDDSADYDPMNGHGGSTEIGVGLKVAHGIADQFLNDTSTTLKKSAVVVIMSDGASDKEDEAIAAANALKSNERISICTTLFARTDSSDEKARQLLLQIASSPKNYKTVYDANSLRDFFVASVSVVTPKKFREGG